MTHEDLSAGDTRAQLQVRQDFLGLEFDQQPLPELLPLLRQLSQANRFSYVVTPNVDHVVALHMHHRPGWHRDLVAAYEEARLCLCDSRVLAALARLSGAQMRVIPGSDLTRSLCEKGLWPGDRVALIGGDVAQLRWLQERWPRVEFVQLVPPMGLRDDPAAREATARFVEAADCAFVLFAVGAPQSELIAMRIARRGVARGVGLCIGASIEFLTGTKRRAPALVQRAGLEWAFRLASEPRRLWRRYLVDGPRIFTIWWRWRKDRAASL